MALFKMNLCWFAILTIQYLTKVSFGEEFAPIVQLNSGKVRGTIVQSDDGSKVLAYQGIRYGHAARFRRFAVTEHWSDVYNATHWRDACPQNGLEIPPYNDPKAQTKTMSEDCLFVSVWRPQTEKKDRAVMVYFHGGGFIVGTIFTTMYDGRYLASRDVVVVTVNSRLGVLGYLYGNTTDAPGNQALWDQYLALRWVHENIHAFGGDPKKITIFGESAGAFPVAAFSVSPLTKGLFQRAILQSGAPSSATTNKDSHALKQTETVAKLLNCTTSADHMSDTLKCLRSKSVSEILKAQKTLEATGGFQFPIIGDLLLPFDNFVRALNSGFNNEIDFMYGVTLDEGTLLVGRLFSELNSNQTMLTIEKAKQYIMKIYSGNKFTTEIVNFYTRNLHFANQTELRLVISRAFADSSILCPTILFGEAIAKGSPNRKHYAYRLTQPTKTEFPLAGGCKGWYGVCHGEDVVYLFGVAHTKENPDDYQMSKAMLNAWTSFAKTGNPGKLGPTEWTEAVTVNDPYTTHMNLDTKNFQMIKDTFKETCNVFWKPKIFV